MPQKAMGSRTQEGCTSTYAIGCLGGRESAQLQSPWGIVVAGEIADSENMIVTNNYRYIDNVELNNTIFLRTNKSQ
jgi:hypothetical protein